jgi:nucleoside-diphosphate-sugar epimerase
LKSRKHVIFPSSIAANGPSDTDITEESPLQPKSLYGNSKVACEEVLLDLLPMKCTIFRIGNVYGSLSTRGELVESLIRAGLSGAVVKVNLNPDSERDFIHVTDVVSAMVKASDFAKILCIGTGRGIRIGELVEVVGQVLNARIRVSFAKNAPRDRYVVNPSRLKSSIDFNPRCSLQDGIRETAEWIKQTTVRDNN